MLRWDAERKMSLGIGLEWDGMFIFVKNLFKGTG